MIKDDSYKSKIAVVIPYYNASAQIIGVISELPEYVDLVVIVDDNSQEELPKNSILENLNPITRCHFLKNEINLGVGGATKAGFEHVLEEGF